MNKLSQTEKKCVNEINAAQSAVQIPGRVGVQTITGPQQDKHRNRKYICRKFFSNWIMSIESSNQKWINAMAR